MRREPKGALLHRIPRGSTRGGGTPRFHLKTPAPLTPTNPTVRNTQVAPVRPPPSFTFACSVYVPECLSWARSVRGDSGDRTARRTALAQASGFLSGRGDIPITKQ